MDIKCPKCGNHITVPEDEIIPGNRIPCPVCDHVIEIREDSIPLPMFKPAGYSIIAPNVPPPPPPLHAPLYGAPPVYSPPPPPISGATVTYRTPVTGYQSPVTLRYGIPQPIHRKPFFTGGDYLRISGLGLMLFYLLLLINIIALVYSFYLVPVKMWEYHYFSLYFIVPFPPFIVGWVIPAPSFTVAIFHMILVLIILASINLMYRQEGTGFIQLMKRIFYSTEDMEERTLRDFENNSFVLLGQFFMALIFFDYAYYFVLFMLGIRTNIPEELLSAPAYKLMYWFARAAVWEEVIARMLLIGLPLLLIRVGWMHVKKEGRTTSAPDTIQQDSGNIPWYTYLLGGGFEITPLTSGLVLFSSILFGLAHSGGWDYYKVIPTAVSGLAFGYLFLKKGVHVSIMLHFAFDYMGVLGKATGNGFEEAILTFDGLALLVIFFIGALIFYNLSMKVMRFLSDALSQRDNREMPPEGRDRDIERWGGGGGMP